MSTTAAPTRPVRATPKVYPNLRPGMNVQVNRENIVTLERTPNDYLVRKGQSNLRTVPNAKYNFVTNTDGSVVMHPRYRHPPLADGKAVLYAGEAYFTNGKLDWWSNASGNYRPDDSDAVQAGLPMERFYNYGDILRGRQFKKESSSSSSSSSGTSGSRSSSSTSSGT